MRGRHLLFVPFFWGGLLLMAACQQDTTGPKELLEKYFSSAVRQDYGTTYVCYYAPYKDKVTREEYIKHRKEGSVLQSYKINSINLSSSGAAEAEVQLTFGPSEKLNRKEPVTVTLKEDLIKENGEWKVKVW